MDWITQTAAWHRETEEKRSSPSPFPPLPRPDMLVVEPRRLRRFGLVWAFDCDYLLFEILAQVELYLNLFQRGINFNALEEGPPFAL